MDLSLKQEIAKMMKRLDEPFEPSPLVVSQEFYDEAKKQGYNMSEFAVRPHA